MGVFYLHPAQQKVSSQVRCLWHEKAAQQTKKRSIAELDNNTTE
jgi:hypothetical protein